MQQEKGKGISRTTNESKHKLQISISFLDLQKNPDVRLAA